MNLHPHTKVEIVDAEKGIKKITVHNERGLTAVFLTLGASIYSIHVPNRDGQAENVVLQYADPKEFLVTNQYYGKTIGRTCGRIGGSKFQIGQKTYTLEANDGDNNLHASSEGFHTKNFKVKIRHFRFSTKIIFRYMSPDGENGFPGNLRFYVIYTIYRYSNEILMNYDAFTDATTPLNITNHCYFNLSGDAKDTILDHTLQVNAGNYISMNEQMIGYAIIPLNRTLDFQSPKKIGKAIKNSFLQDHTWRGYDHGYVREQPDSDQPFAILYDEKSGREMKIHTDYPCLNVYSDNYFSGKKLSSGKEEVKYQAVCLEPEYVPFAVERYLLKPRVPFHKFIRLTFKTRSKI